MTDIPAVPFLRSGVGATPADGGCVMQVVDWIHRNEWTDHPPCVHPVLRSLAIRANDTLDDTGRQRLLDLAPRLMNTASDDRVLTVRLAVFCARWVLPLFEAKHPDDGRPMAAIEAAERWCDNPTEENANAADAARSAAYAAYAATANAAYAADAAKSVAYAAYYAAANAANAAKSAADAADAAYAAYAARSVANAANAAAYACPDKMALLAATLDEYDRLTGRTDYPELDYTGVCEAMGATA